MNFITEDFMLKNKVAKKLYHAYAQELPIIDYHCHLNPEMITVTAWKTDARLRKLEPFG